MPRIGEVRVRRHPIQYPLNGWLFRLARGRVLWSWHRLWMRFMCKYEYWDGAQWRRV